MGATVQEIFNQFISIFGHRVIKRRQEEWEQSAEGWDTHALIHMIYWILRDRQQLDHKQAAETLDNLTVDQLKQKLLSLAPELHQKDINHSTSKLKNVNSNFSDIDQELREISDEFNRKKQPSNAKSSPNLNQKIKSCQKFLIFSICKILFQKSILIVSEIY